MEDIDNCTHDILCMPKSKWKVLKCWSVVEIKLKNGTISINQSTTKTTFSLLL